MADREDATQDPTATRLRRAEQSGQFARSREFAVAVTWLAGVALLTTLGAMLWEAMIGFGQASWSTADISRPATDWLGSNLAATRSIFWTSLLPILVAVAVVAALAWWSQGGFRFYPNLAAPDITRLSPIRNFQRIFAMEQVVSVLLGLAKFLALIVVAAWVLIGDTQTLAGFSIGPLASQSGELSRWLASVVQRLCLAAVVVGLLDYGIRWQLHRRSLRMTEQEIRDEQRAMEASPEVSARRRLTRQQ